MSGVGPRQLILKILRQIMFKMTRHAYAWMTVAAAIAATVGKAYLPAVPSFRSLRKVIMQDPTEALAETAKAVREVA